MGVLGAFLGALIGSAIYFVIFIYADFTLKLLAIGVGGLAGVAARWMSREEGSNELGVITATLTLAGIVAAQYFVARIWWNEIVSDSMEVSYESELAEAQEVVKAIPSGTDQEIRLYLAKEYAAEDERLDPSLISAEDIKEFRENHLPGMRDLASGKVTKEEYDKLHEAEILESKAAREEEEGTFKAVFLLLLLSKANLISLCLAAGAAYKIAANA
jgi:hypothetical protein